MFRSPHSRQHLCTVAQAKATPALRSTDGTRWADRVTTCRLFDPCGSFAWYVVELDPTTGEAFGIVVGDVVEVGYFMLPELAQVRGKWGIGIERDTSHDRPMTLAVASLLDWKLADWLDLDDQRHVLAMLDSAMAEAVQAVTMDPETGSK